MNWMILPLKRYAEFAGRSRRQEFWMFALMQFILYVALTTVALVVGVGVAGITAAGEQATSAAGMMGVFAALGIFALVYVVVYFGLFLPNLAVATRRLHDTGRSGLWQLIYWVPWGLGILLSIVGAVSQSDGVVALSVILSGIQYITLIVLIVFYCLEGTRGPNRFGADPKGQNLGDVFA